MPAPQSGDTEDTLLRKIVENLATAFSVSAILPPANEQADERYVLWLKWLKTINQIP